MKIRNNGKRKKVDTSFVDVIVSRSRTKHGRRNREKSKEENRRIKECSNFFSLI